jgi:hypothetical protein
MDFSVSLPIQTPHASPQYCSSQGATGIIGQPPTQSTFGGIKGFIIESLVFMQELLGFANEHEMREKLTECFRR